MNSEQIRWIDLFLLFATLIAPLLAVQAQKWLERLREKRAVQLRIFEALMATRATVMAPRHVDAINAIPLAFYGETKKLKAIKQEWSEYITLLSDRQKTT